MKKKGELAIEYSLLVAITIAALIGMAVYLKRAVCGRWRQSADTFSFGRQFNPRTTTITN